MVFGRDTLLGDEKFRAKPQSYVQEIHGKRLICIDAGNYEERSFGAGEI